MLFRTQPIEKYDVPILISNDSDLVGTLDLIKEHIKTPVGICLQGRSTPYELKKRASFKRKINNNILKSSLFEQRLEDKRGSFFKPQNW